MAVTQQSDESAAVLALMIVFMVLSVFSIALRLISRRIAHLKLWWDDYFIVFLCGYWADIGEVQYGGGKHEKDVGNFVLTQFLIRVYVTEIVYPPIVATNKLSFIFLFLRLFGIDKRFAFRAHILAGLVGAWLIAILFPVLFQCKPIYAAWNPETPDKVCINLTAFLLAANISNIAFDVCIIALPIFRIWDLKLSTGRKIGLSAVFLVGSFTTGVSILRTYYIANLKLDDPTWNYTNVVVWSKVEENVGMICACLPVMLPAFKAIAERCFSGKSKKLSTQGSHGWSHEYNGSIAMQSGARRQFERLNEDGLDPTGVEVEGGRLPASEPYEGTGIKVTNEMTVETTREPGVLRASYAL